MSTTERCPRALAKSMFRAGYILAIVLFWLASLSPLMSQFGNNVQYFAQVGVNGGSTTSFTINNPSTTETITVDAQLYFLDGTPLADGQVELGPGATETLSFGDPQQALTSGWAELKSEGPFIATEFFQLSIGGQLKPRVGVLPSVASDEIRFLGFVNPQFTSGLAVSNPSSTEASEITIRAKDNAGGAPVPEKTLTLLPLHSVAGYLNEEKFLGPGLANYEGVVEITVNSPAVAAVSLIQEAGTGDVATVSVLTQSHIITEGDPTYNTALGIEALANNTTGVRNTASGYRALVSNTIGTDNTASGVRALYNNTTGERNTANGVLALANNTTGSDNIGIGFEAGIGLQSGSNNIYIGNDGAEESDTIRIGDSGHGNAFIAGVQIVPASSRRFKQDIHEMDKASSDLMRLRPVTFRYKKEYDSGEGRLQYGLIAEEAAEVYPELVVSDDTGRVKTVEYQKLPAMLLNELQKQHGQIQEQEAIITDLTERLSRLEQVLSVPRA